ncbi:hypothetical protein V6Z11_A05G430000 [Gossypium hirsutum]
MITRWEFSNCVIFFSNGHINQKRALHQASAILWEVYDLSMLQSMSIAAVS